MKPEPRDPRSLKRHPLLKHFPAPDKKSAVWKGFAHRINADGGISIAVRGTAAGFVLQGWWEVEAACDWQFKSVPYQVEDDARAALVVVEGLLNRESMSVGAKVYFALEIWSDYVDAHERRRLKNCIDRRTTNEETLGGRPARSTPHPDSNRYLAQIWGCDDKTILQARLVRSIFHDLPTFETWLKAENGCHLPAAHEARRDPQSAQAKLRADFEPLLFSGEKSLWKILQAAAGDLAGTRQDPQAEQLELFGKGFGRLLTSWEKLTEDAREVAAKKLPALLAELPEDLQSAIEAALPKARKLSQAS